MATILPEFDEDGKLLNKDALISQKEKELKKNYAQLDGKRKKNALMLISSAAFMSISMMELEKIITIKGYTETYQNGATQSGIKKCSEVEIYQNMAKNYLSYIKQLDDMLKSTAKQDGADDLINFISK